MPAEPDNRTPFARFSHLVLRTAARSLSRLRIEGLERVPRRGPFLLVSNHASNADGLLLISFVSPRVDGRIGWLGKEEAMRWPVLGWTLRQNGVFGIRRGASDLEAFRVARGLLDEGNCLAVFPEGTRSPSGALQEAKEGATVLAMRSGAPILPVGIAGTHEFWPKGRLIPRPGRRIVVRIGEPFTLMPRPDLNRHDAVRAATVEIMSHIAALLPPSHRGVYAGTVRR